jgi:hypothetical protein
MAIDDGLREVDREFAKTYCAPAESFHFQSPLSGLQVAASARAVATQTQFISCASSCTVAYVSGNHEIQVCHTGLMFLEYVAGLLRDKAKPGHCRNHPKPCKLTRELHVQVLEEMKAQIDALGTEIEKVLAEVPNWPPTAP